MMIANNAVNKNSKPISYGGFLWKSHSLLWIDIFLITQPKSVKAYRLTEWSIDEISSLNEQVTDFLFLILKSSQIKRDWWSDFNKIIF
jgi:hypothetical protein